MGFWEGLMLRFRGWNHPLLVDVPYVCVNNKIIPSTFAVKHRLNPEHYGLSFFEGIRIFKAVLDNGEVSQNTGFIYRLKDHLQRLRKSATILNMTIPLSDEEITEAVVELAKANKLTEGYLRINVTYNTEKMGLIHDSNVVDIFIAFWRWGSYHNTSRATAFSGSSYSIPTVNKRLTSAKRASNYDYRSLALQEAKEFGADEVFLECSEWGADSETGELRPQQYILEGSAQNIFLIKKIDGITKVITPPTDYILEGITRKTAIEIIEDSNIECRVENFSFSDITENDSIFLTGTATGILPVGKIIRKVDDQLFTLELADSELTDKIKNTYQSIVTGQHSRSSDLLTRVNLN